MIPKACKDGQVVTLIIECFITVQTHGKYVFVNDPGGKRRLTARWLEATSKGQKVQDIINSCHDTRNTECINCMTSTAE